MNLKNFQETDKKIWKMEFVVPFFGKQMGVFQVLTEYILRISL